MKRGILALLFLIAATKAQAIDVVAMYRGSCQVDTGVVLRVDSKSVTYLAMTGKVVRIPRYEVVGIASYPLPGLPVKGFEATKDVTSDLFEFHTYRDGKVVPLATGWPIEYNAEHIQVLTQTGRDHLVVRDEIWGVKAVPPGAGVAFDGSGLKQQAYRLRHPLTFEKCADNVTSGAGDPIPIIPQVTYDNPIAIKRYHDHLKEGYAKIKEYEDRQGFYAVPQYYSNRTFLGTWAILGSRYANIGARQVNFLPLVQDELSDGPFGFQRIVRSGVAPLAWGLHEEPTVQIFYGLKADYVHFEFFVDPTAPLIGQQYNYSIGQLNSVDDRLVEKGGVEFGFDFGYFALVTAFSEGNMAIRGGDYFHDESFGSSRSGMAFQYNYYKLAFYLGNDTVELDDYLSHDFRVLKVLAQGPLTSRMRLRVQTIARSLTDKSGKKRPITYDSSSKTVAAQLDWDLNYRWTVQILGSAETIAAEYTIPTSGETDNKSKTYPKLASGVTVAF